MTQSIWRGIALDLQLGESGSTPGKDYDILFALKNLFKELNGGGGKEFRKQSGVYIS